MLSNVHKQLLASRLKDIFGSSPLVLVYQTLGNVRSEDLSNSMQKELDKQLPGSGVQATCIKLKNTIALATGQDAVARFLQTNNLLLGWQLPQHSRLDQLLASKDTHLRDLLATPASHPASQPPSQASLPFPADATGSALQGNLPASMPSQNDVQHLSLPHNTIKAIISLSLGASRNQPVALLTSFYRGEQVKIKQLLEWSKLDERAVHTELLSQLDSPLSELVGLGGAPEALVDALSDAEPHGVLEALEFLANRQEQSI